MPVTNNDYVFVEKNPNETSYVKLVAENEWSGTVFQYGNLKVHVNEETDEAHLNFTYNIIESPLHEDMLNEDEGFKNYIGEVLQQIITDALDKGEYSIGRKASDDDITELDNE
jgi:hypothetical protein